MTRNLLRLCIGVLVLAPLVACESTKSANPLSPTVAGPIPGVNITPPKPLEPGNGWKLNPAKQPVTLLLENASSNGVYAPSVTSSKSPRMPPSARRCSPRRAWRLDRPAARAFK